MWPLNPMRLLNKPRPQDDDDVQVLLGVDALVSMYEQHRSVARRTIMGEDVTLLRNGNVNTRRGAVLTSEGALRAARNKAKVVMERELREKAERTAKDLRAAQVAAKRQIVRKRTESIVTLRRARLANMHVDAYRAQIRPMKLRRAHAKSRKASRMANHAGITPTQLMMEAVRLAREVQEPVPLGVSDTRKKKARLDDIHNAPSSCQSVAACGIETPGSQEGSPDFAHAHHRSRAALSKESNAQSGDGTTAMSVLVALAAAAKNGLDVTRAARRTSPYEK
eukprot:IDg21812t1